MTINVGIANQPTRPVGQGDTASMIVNTPNRNTPA